MSIDHALIVDPAKLHAPKAHLHAVGDLPATPEPRRTVIPTGWESIDEFNDGVLDGAWTQVSPAGGSARALFAEGNGGLSVTQVGGDTASVLHGFMRALTAGDLAVGEAIETYLRMTGPYVNYTMAGIVLSDGVVHGAGAQVHTLNFLALSNPYTVNDVRLSTNWTSSTTAGVNNVVGGGAGGYYTRIVRTAASTWRCDVSPDGISWVLGTASVTRAITCGYVGVLASSWGTATKAVISYDYLRRGVA